MDLEKINPHPLNEKIYENDKVQQDELKKTIEMLGLLEPLTITKDNTLVSGHRRLQALKEIGWEDVDCRISEFENLTLSLVELNRYRKKTSKELLNEAHILKQEYQNVVKMGRPKKGESRNGKNWSIVNVSGKLGVSTTNLKKLMSIQKYSPDLLSKIDMGLISINKAYEIVRKKYILKQDSKSQQNNFDKDFKKLMKKYNLKVDESILPKIYQKLGVI